METARDGFEPRVCLVTCPPDGAARLARRIVELRLAACVNRLPVTSVFHWGGAVEEEGEELLVIKSSRERLAGLEELLEREHPYDVPELVSLAPDGVGAGYLAWWALETRRGDESPGR